MATLNGSWIPTVMPQCLRELSHVELRPRLHATQTPCVTGFQIGGCARLPLRVCVPAWFPRSRIRDRRFTSDLEVAWGA